MNANAAITLGLLATFAALVAVHVTNLFGLVARRRFAAAVGGLLFPPSAPFSAFRAGMRARAVGWVVLAVAYVVLFLLAL